MTALPSRPTLRERAIAAARPLDAMTARPFGGPLASTDEHAAARPNDALRAWRLDVRAAISR